MQRVEFVPHYRCYSERCIGNRAGLHAKIAEPPPILCKDTNKPRAKANLFAFCRGEVSKKKSKMYCTPKVGHFWGVFYEI